jgi:hypothetical protein
MSDSEAPVISVVKGSPTDEELAAVVTVLTAAAATSEPVTDRSDKPLAGGWKSYTRTVRQTRHPGPGAWRYTYR